MWTLFTDRDDSKPLATRLLLPLLLLLVAGCASKPADELDRAAGEASRYAEERQGSAAADSDAEHVPPVPHDPAVVPYAEEAMGEYGRALQTLANGDQQRALVMFRSLASRYPQLSGPRVNEGLILLQRDDYEGAQQAFETALQINPGNPYAHNGLGLTLREQGQFRQAQTHYQQAIELDPKYARAHFNLAVLGELYLQDLSLALRHFQHYQALQREPDSTVANWIADLERRAPQAVADHSNDEPGA